MYKSLVQNVHVTPPRKKIFSAKKPSYDYLCLVALLYIHSTIEGLVAKNTVHVYGDGNMEMAVRPVGNLRFFIMHIPTFSVQLICFENMVNEKTLDSIFTTFWSQYFPKLISSYQFPEITV